MKTVNNTNSIIEFLTVAIGASLIQDIYFLVLGTSYLSSYCNTNTITELFFIIIFIFTAHRFIPVNNYCNTFVNYTSIPEGHFLTSTGKVYVHAVDPRFYKHSSKLKA